MTVPALPMEGCHETPQNRANAPAQFQASQVIVITREMETPQLRKLRRRPRKSYPQQVGWAVMYGPPRCRKQIHGIAEANMYTAFLGLKVRDARRHHGKPKRVARPNHPAVLSIGGMTATGLRAAAGVRGRDP